jgi:hypothetical protein
MAEAEKRLAQTYGLYLLSPAIEDALRSDLRIRFALEGTAKPGKMADIVARTTLALADARSVERF